eukprot:SM013231S26846  [mRNA]  locus=s13231:78:383:+ [translate_table: standard]
MTWAWSGRRACAAGRSRLGGASSTTGSARCTRRWRAATRCVPRCPRTPRSSSSPSTPPSTRSPATATGTPTWPTPWARRPARWRRRCAKCAPAGPSSTAPPG